MCTLSCVSLSCYYVSVYTVPLFSVFILCSYFVYVSIMLLLHLRQSNGDTVTQIKGSVLISQGDPVVVNCTYEAVSPYLFWYVQFPNQPLRLFLKDLGRVDSDEGIRKGFNATHDKVHKSFHLLKPSSELRDSATYYCGLTEQKPPRGCGSNLRLLGATRGGRRRNSGLWKELGGTSPALTPQ
uniref:Immunoglobulin domain-containing protein n=1 Tax=Chelydra serpentina TaxID=8475 RepID=A0A8C3SGT7_CHESE